VSNLLKKLGLASRQEATAWLLKNIPEMSDDL
jgi:DNA-binding NarL/FixJ family response regulator